MKTFYSLTFIYTLGAMILFLLLVGIQLLVDWGAKRHPEIPKPDYRWTAHDCFVYGLKWPLIALVLILRRILIARSKKEV